MWTLVGAVCLLLCCVSGTPTISPEGSAARDTMEPQLTIVGGISAVVLARAFLATLRNHDLVPALVYFVVALLAPLIAHGTVVLWLELGARVYPGSFFPMDDGRIVPGHVPEGARRVLGLLLFACMAVPATPVGLALQRATREEAR